ncbi:MAG: aminomethyltransferase family protein, partial [Burkholderiaceae bacterium]|nr:aminomethyltransferase family protein [Burkholderiaceae bacterium]
LLVQGPDARTALDWLVANELPAAIGGTVYTGMLNDRGGYESDVTITQVGDDAYLIVTSSGSAVRDRDVIDRALRARGWRCAVTDVTPKYAMLAVMGPRSRELMGRVSTARFDHASFPFGTSQEIDVGYATVRATRLTYVGELGWELYVPVEFAVGVYERLMEAGRDLGLTDAGYYAIESLRLEKGYRAWGRELTPDVNPFEAGLAFAVKLDKGEFRGRDALARIQGEGVKRRIVSLVVDAPHTNLWGNELVLRDGRAVGFVTSAAFGHTLGKPVALALIANADGAADKAWVESGRYEIELAGERYAASASLKAPLDSSAARA